MYRRRILRDVDRVLWIDVRICEELDLLDNVVGTYLGKITNRKFKRLATLMYAEMRRCDQKYHDTNVDKLKAGEQIRYRRAVARIDALRDDFYFELEMRFCGQFTSLEWLRIRDQICITKGWLVWKVAPVELDEETGQVLLSNQPEERPN